MKPCLNFGLLLSVIVTLTIALPFKQHHPEKRPDRPFAKLEQMRQDSENRAQQDKLELPLRPRHENRTGIREDDWYRKMNALGGRPNGIPGQRSDIYGSQNNNPRPQARTGNQPGFFETMFPGQQNGGKPGLPNNWSQEEAARPLPIKPRPRPAQNSRSRVSQSRNEEPPHHKIDKTCGCNPIAIFECGEDGKTYQNSCYRICAAVTFLKAGTC